MSVRHTESCYKRFTQVPDLFSLSLQILQLKYRTQVNTRMVLPELQHVVGFSDSVSSFLKKGDAGDGW